MSTTELEARPDGHTPNTQEPDDREAPAQRAGEQSGQDASGKKADGKDEKPRESLGARLRRHPLLVGIVLLVLLAAIAAGVLWWLQARHYESSDDAFIDARMFSVAPEVTGYIVDVPIHDNEDVAAGTVLARIDERDYKIALDQADAQVKSAEAGIVNIDAQIASQKTQVERAQAQVKQAEAAVQFAQQQADRYKHLEETAGGTVQQAQQTASQLLQQQADLTAAQAQVDVVQQQIVGLGAQRASAVANLAQAHAQRDKAALDLGRTTIKAAQAGRLVNLTAAKGQYAQPGQSLMMFVPDTIWVTANFKETQITDMRPGQPVALSVDAYPDIEFRGHVDSIQAGSGTAFSLLPAQNATGNYVKVVQRIPVKIVLENVPKDIVLGPGMSVVPSVRVR